MARLVHSTLLKLNAEGALAPDLAAVVPEVEAGGRLFRFHLKPGLRFQDGTAIAAQDVVESLTRLADPSLGSPYAALALPLVGAIDGGRISGLAATGELDVQASLAFAYPDWLRGLAHPAAAPLPGGKAGLTLAGAGPMLMGGALGAGEARLSAYADCSEGRPFVDSLRLTVADARGASRALTLGEADAVLGAIDKRAVEGPALFATYLAFNSARLGPHAALVRQALEASVDVTELARFFVRGAVPMAGLLPPALEPSGATQPQPARPTLPKGLQLVLLVDATADDQRAVAERLQVKLHDFGVSVQLKRLAKPEYRQALATAGYDLALIAVAALPEPGLALAQLVLLSQGRDAARELLRTVGAGADPSARRQIALAQSTLWRGRLALMPLYAQVPRVLLRAGVA
ncbi:MAG: hypothetical protein HY901_14080, partial [Deltaproteobacteria bacterium]|nr:hypothetical protein [Deltaproteobacteria bacterium]